MAQRYEKNVNMYVFSRFFCNFAPSLGIYKGIKQHNYGKESTFDDSRWMGNR